MDRRLEKTDLLERSIGNLLKRREGLIEVYGLEHHLVASINRRIAWKKKRLEEVKLKPLKQGRLF